MTKEAILQDKKFFFNVMVCFRRHKMPSFQKIPRKTGSLFDKVMIFGKIVTNLKMI